MKGDLIFFSGTDLVSRVIRLVTNGPFSHVAIALSDTTMLSVAFSGVMVEVPIPPDGIIHATSTRCASHLLESALTWAMAQQGFTYDYTDALQIGLYSLLPFLKKPIVEVQTKEYICSELTGYFLLKAGYPFAKARTFQDMEYVSPNQLFRWLS